MDFEQLNDEWCESSTDLLIVLETREMHSDKEHPRYTKEQQIALYQKCLSMSRDEKNAKIESYVCNRLGLLCGTLSRWNDAIVYFEDDLKTRKETDDLTGTRNAYGNLGVAHDSLGQYKEAIECHLEDLRISKEIGDKTGEGKAYRNLGVAYDCLGQYHIAIGYHMEDLRISKTTNDMVSVGVAYCNLGVAHYSLDQHKKAIECHMAALKISLENGDIIGEGTASCNLGAAYESLRDNDMATQYYSNHSRIAKESNDLEGQCIACGNLGAIYHSTGKHQEAVQYYMDELRISKVMGDAAREGKANCNLGIAYNSSGMCDKAVTYFRNSVAVYQDNHDILGEAQGHCNIAKAQVLLGNLTEAECSLQRTVACYGNVLKHLDDRDPFKESIVETFIKTYQFLTFMLVRGGKKQEALLVSESGRTLAVAERLALKYGLLKEKNTGKDSLDAKSLVEDNERSIIILSNADSWLCAFLAQHEKGLNTSCVEIADYLSSFESSNNSLEKSQDILRTFITKGIEAANAYVKAEQDVPCEDRFLELSEKDDEDIDNGMINGTTEEETESSNGYESYEGESPPTTTPSTGIGLNDYPYHLVLDAEGKHDENSLKPEVSSNPLQAMYQLIIAPVQSALNHSEIVIVPEGPLYLVPFAALVDDEGHFLTEVTRIRLATSLSSLKLPREFQEKEHCKTGALLVGGPVTGEVIFRGNKRTFSNLPFARKEASLIGSILGEQPLTGPAATKAVVKRRLREGVSVVHIATLGNAATGEILLAPEHFTGKEVPTEEDYILTVREIKSSGVNAQLVVLSCCHSGRGDIAAEEVVGLSQAFLAAGALAVMASLWPVNDRATLIFMRTFYRRLKSGGSASESLQEARRELRESEEWSHPYYWAPFFLMGNDVTIDI